MANDFSLSKPKENVFPYTVTVEGKAYEIDPDFRVVLKVFKMIGDNNIFDGQKMKLLSKWFYKDDTPYNPLQGFIDFVNTEKKTGGETASGKHKAKQFDYEYDAEEIYISFLKEYNINLVYIDFLHWYDFRLRLEGLSYESAFRQKIRVRFMDLKGLKGKDLSDMTALKKSVQLPVEMSREEERRMEELHKRLRGN